MTIRADVFVVPALTFKLLFVFIVLAHDRRRILHVNVTANPTVSWTARQLVEGFPVSIPRFLLRDRDSIYEGWAFRQMVAALERVGSGTASDGTASVTFDHDAGPGTYHYQLWYRNLPAGFCTPDAFNLSNARSITWP